MFLGTVENTSHTCDTHMVIQMRDATTYEEINADTMDFGTIIYDTSPGWRNVIRCLKLK